MERRDLIKKSLIGIGALALTVPAMADKTCVGKTPPQTEGPFYPVHEKLDTDNDLTYRKDKSVEALGERVYITGIVSDAACTPIAGALVEIWQACQSGKYDHPSDPNPAPADPNFQYFGRAVTDSNGEYIFKTIRPGAYPASADWMRPAHIHYKVLLKGFEELTTQMYFADDPFNGGDLILQNLPEAERKKVIVDFSQTNINGIPSGKFDLTLKKVLPSGSAGKGA